MDKNSNKLKFILDCLVCNSRFNREDIGLVNQNENKLIFHATCPKCKSAALIVLSSVSEGENPLGMGMLTDLNREEVKEIFTAKAITADEVIDFYNVMYHG